MLPQMVAPDGSPVELYALMPDRGEGELVASALPAGATILELGCGTGRMTRQLVSLGFRVTAVDESADMLAHVHDAEAVHSRIEDLDLGRRFDVVLLASNLLSSEPDLRRSFLRACRRHADVLIVETLPLGWTPKQGDAQIGDVISRMRVARVDDGVVHGSVEYEARGRYWTHEFAMRVFADEPELDAALAEEGFCFDRWISRDRGWFVARTVQAGP